MTTSYAISLWQFNSAALAGGGYGTQAGTFLIDIIFGILTFIVMFRFLLQLARADFRNPLSQAIVKMSNPMLKPFRRIIPGFAGIDFASIVVMFLLVMIKLSLTLLIADSFSVLQFRIGFGPDTTTGILRMVVASVFILLDSAIWIYIFAIIILAIASWIVQGGYNPVLALLYQLTNPVMQPIRRIMPTAAGIDFSPLVAIIILMLIQMAFPYLMRSLI